MFGTARSQRGRVAQAVLDWKVRAEAAGARPRQPREGLWLQLSVEGAVADVEQRSDLFWAVF